MFYLLNPLMKKLHNKLHCQILEKILEIPCQIIDSQAADSFSVKKDESESLLGSFI